MFLLEKIGENVKIRIIGVTGNVSSGKSTLLNTLSDIGFATLSVDAVISNLYNNNQELIEKIINLLGECILTKKSLDKAKIAKKVFLNKTLLQSLERITTPYVMEKITKFIEQEKGKCAIEIPLLFELSLQNFFDYIILVKAPRAICKNRSNVSFFSSRWDRFDSYTEKEKKANITINNSDTIANFKNTIANTVQGII